MALIQLGSGKKIPIGIRSREPGDGIRDVTKDFAAASKQMTMVGRRHGEGYVEGLSCCH